MFERDGFDVHSDVHISFTQAVLGGEVRTRGLSGPILVKVWSPVWSLLVPGGSPVVTLVLRFRLVLRHIIGSDLPTGESPDSTAMATETTTFMSRSKHHG